MEDIELLKKISNGDSKAFESLMKKHQNAVYGLSLRILGASMLAEENVQETWIRVVRSAGTFQQQEKASVLSWILKITKNLALNILDKRGWEDQLSDEKENQISDSAEDISTTLQKAEDMKALKKAIDSLPDRQRVVLVLWMHEEKSYSELAVEMGININAVKVLLFRAKENLEKALKGSHL